MGTETESEKEARMLRDGISMHPFAAGDIEPHWGFEPTFGADAVAAAFKALKEAGVHAELRISTEA